MALMLALDRNLLTEKVTQFGELPSFALVPPGIRDYVSPVPEWAEWTQAEREAEARRLYAMAGYSEENPLKFEIRYTAGENNKKMACVSPHYTILRDLWTPVLRNSTHSAMFTAWSPRRSRYLSIINKSSAVSASPGWAAM